MNKKQEGADKPNEKIAVCLLSGGLDSAVTMAVARKEGFRCHAISFDYGQRHRVELDAALRVARTLEAEQHKVVRLDLRQFGGSALTADMDVPKHRAIEQIANGIPVTYVPARNTIFLAYALAYAEVLGAKDIFVGVNAIDYSGYPDCRPEYIHAFQTLANLATKAGLEGGMPLRIHTPLITLSKAGIIQLGASLGVDFSITHSCYDPLGEGRPCGACDSCLLRRKGFAECGLQDPLPYPE